MEPLSPQSKWQGADVGPQGVQAPDGGLDVLGGLGADHLDGALPQGGADQQPVGRRLGGHGGQGALGTAGLNGDGHCPNPLSIQVFSSPTGTGTSWLRPQAVGTTREMVSPARFLSERVFSYRSPAA